MDNHIGVMTRARMRQHTEMNQNADQGLNTVQSMDTPVQGDQGPRVDSHSRQSHSSSATIPAYMHGTPRTGSASTPQDELLRTAIANSGASARNGIVSGRGTPINQQDPLPRHYARRERETFDLNKYPELANINASHGGSIARSLPSRNFTRMLNESEDETDDQPNAFRPTSRQPLSAPGAFNRIMADGSTAGSVGSRMNGTHTPSIRPVNSITHQSELNIDRQNHLDAVRNFAQSHSGPRTNSLTMALSPVSVAWNAPVQQTESNANVREEQLQAYGKTDTREERIFYRLIENEDPRAYTYGQQFASLLKCAERAYEDIEKGIENARTAHHRLMESTPGRSTQLHQTVFTNDLGELSKAYDDYCDIIGLWRETIGNLTPRCKENAEKEYSLYDRFIQFDGNACDPYQIEETIFLNESKWRETAQQLIEENALIASLNTAPATTNTGHNDPTSHNMRRQFDELNIRNQDQMETQEHNGEMNGVPDYGNRAISRRDTPLDTNTNASSSTHPPGIFPFATAKIAFPIFSGDKLKWETFESLVNATIEHFAGSNPITKILFLRQHLAGKALQEVEHLSEMNPRGYERAMETLRRLYGNARDRSKMYVQEISKMVKTSDDVTESKSSILKLLGIMGRFIEEDRTSANSVSTRELITAKLPSRINIDIYNKEEFTECTMEIEELIEFIHKRMHHAIKEQEMALAGRVERPRSYSNRNESNTHRQPEMNDNTCAFCGLQGHASEVCRRYTGESRYDRLKETNRCFRCLKARNNQHAFPCPKNCQICGRSHHRAICFHASRATQSPMGSNAGSHATDANSIPLNH